MGKRQNRAYLSSYWVLLTHLLKWHFQRDRRSRSWAVTILRERVNIRRRESKRGGLQTMSAERLSKIYERARREAARETELHLSVFPAECP
ncbi:MAG: DUF29 family protein [Rhizobiaceae bacterium]|nr:DUF29 family protein [Rhizobiaceae bacterium]